MGQIARWIEVGRRRGGVTSPAASLGQAMAGSGPSAPDLPGWRPG
jgi:hypothetical protein